MVLLVFLSLLFYLALPASNTVISEKPHRKEPQDTKQVPEDSINCPNYIEYSKKPHYDARFPKTPLNLPRQRPLPACRTFRSDVIEKFLSKFVRLLKDPDVAILFENTFPNTLDTSILWHSSPENENDDEPSSSKAYGTFIVTGDIHAEWLRDSAWQLSVYQPFLKDDKPLRELFRWAIYTQSVYIKGNPYCNAFQPPPGSNVSREKSSVDEVTPYPDWRAVFECKYEIDSLASFLQLSYQYYSGVSKEEQFRFVTREWLLAVEQVLNVVERESISTFADDGSVNRPPYTFKRWTTTASETLAISGTGNPVNAGTGLVRSAFRPSDDATIFQFFIPGNAFLAVELEHLVVILQQYLKYSYSGVGNRDSVNLKDINIKELINKANSFAKSIRAGIMEHAVVEHPKFGKVFAYEVDGYGSHLLMDDANIPSLLSLPDLGFIDVNNEIYQNTRSMILTNKGNPYFINGPFFQGIGGPHIGLRNPWPMSQIVRMRTSNDDEEIKQSLKLVLENTGGLGLIHESVDGFVDGGTSYTRSWFAWANSEFAKSIIDLAARKPHLIFNRDAMLEDFNLNNFLTQI